MSAGPAPQFPPSHPVPPRAVQRPLTPPRALLRYIAGLMFCFFAEVVSMRAARGLAPEDWRPLVSAAMFLFLAVVGYAGLGFLLNGQQNPVAEQGLSFRRGWPREVALGLALGWGIAVACVLPLFVFPGVAVHFSFDLSDFGWLVADGAYLALVTLGAQVAFRGYTFQMAIRALGELPATLLMAAVYAATIGWRPGALWVHLAENFAIGLLLSMAYLRTRALWLPWGLQMGWVASRTLLFGLPYSGLDHAGVVQGYPMAESAFWGAQDGLDASWLAFALILLAMPFVYRATRDLSFVYNAPVLEPGGIPVDLDAAARSQHEAATRPDLPEVKPLVQILPVAPAPLAPAGGLDPSRATESVVDPARDPASASVAFPER